MTLHLAASTLAPGSESKLFLIRKVDEDDYVVAFRVGDHWFNERRELICSDAFIGDVRPLTVDCN